MTKSIKFPIRFKFDLDKFIACVSILAKEKLSDLDKLKVSKLLYYADKYHLIRYGRPIFGDRYVHLDHGPVPSKALDIMNEVICGDRVFVFSGDISNKDRFGEYLKPKKNMFHRFPVFELMKEPNLDCLSASELEAIRETMGRYGKYKPEELIEMTHKDASWEKTQNTEEIDYRLFFENESEAKQEALEYLESLREDSEIIFGLDCSD